MKKPVIISALTLVALCGVTAATTVPSVEKHKTTKPVQEASAALIYRDTQMPSRSDDRVAIVKAHRNIQSAPAPKPAPVPAPKPVVHEAPAPVAVVHHYAKPVQRYVAPQHVQPAGSPKAYAESQVGSGQFSCLEALWNKESGWNTYASNSSSGAYGIPQALPGSKMASAGSDWQTNPYTQINWGLGYIRSTYGTPCNAWGHSQANGWY